MPARTISTPRALGLVAVALNLALIVAAVALFPIVLGSERTIFVIADVLILLAYAAWFVFGPGPVARSLSLGAVAGFIQFADIAREYFTTWPAWLLLVAMVISLGLFAGVGTKLTLSSAVAQGAYAAMTTMLVLWALAWILDAAAPGPIGSAVSGDPDYRASGPHEISAYIVWNTLSAAFSHAILLPLLGVAAAAIGSRVKGLGARTESKNRSTT